MGKPFQQWLPQTMEQVCTAARNVKDEGRAIVAGQPVRVFSHDVDTRIMGIAAASHVRVSLDGDGRIVRSESDGTAMGEDSHAVQTVRNDDIRVTAPR